MKASGIGVAFFVFTAISLARADSGQGSSSPANYYHQPYHHNIQNDPRMYYQQPQAVEQRQPRANEVTAETTEREGQLPDGWIEYLDPASGKPYYYNVADRTTTWTRPAPTTTPAAPEFIGAQQRGEVAAESSGLLDQDKDRKDVSDTQSIIEPQTKSEVKDEKYMDAFKDNGSDLNKADQFGDEKGLEFDKPVSYESWGSNQMVKEQEQPWTRSDSPITSELQPQATKENAQIPIPSNQNEMMTQDRQAFEDKRDMKEPMFYGQRTMDATKDTFQHYHPSREQPRFGYPQQMNQPEPMQNYPPQSTWDRHQQQQHHQHQPQRQPQYPSAQEGQRAATQGPPTGWAQTQASPRLQDDSRTKPRQSYEDPDKFSDGEKRNEMQHPARESWEPTHRAPSVLTAQHQTLQPPDKTNVPSESMTNPPVSQSVDSRQMLSRTTDSVRDSNMSRMNPESVSASIPPGNIHTPQTYPQSPPGWYSSPPQYVQPQGQSIQQQQPYSYNGGPYGMPASQGRPSSYGPPPQGYGYRPDQMGNMPIPPRGPFQPQQQQQHGQMVSQSSSTTSAVKEALGSAWQGFLGFGSKTKELMGQAKETVVQSASQVGDAVSVTSVGLWGKAKSSVENLGKSLFEGEQTKPEEDQYSLSQYGVPPAPGQTQTRYPPQNYGGPPPGYGLPGPRVVPVYPHNQQRYNPQDYPPHPPHHRGQDRPPMQSYWGNQPQSTYGPPNPGVPPHRQGPYANARPGPYRPYDAMPTENKMHGGPPQGAQIDRQLSSTQYGRQGTEPDGAGRQGVVNPNAPRQQVPPDPRGNPKNSNWNPSQHPGWDGM